MIISRTPLRMSFVGGGSDLPNFYTKFGGAVVSTSIDKYIYVNVNKKFDDAIRISYSKTEEVQTIDQIEHELVRETLKRLNIKGGLEITSVADIPAKGTGLGSSSSFTVGLLLALNAYHQNFASAEVLARESCHIEIESCKAPIGKQDQYAAAYGGFNFIEFNTDGSVFVNPIICSRDTIQTLENNILVFYTGQTRSASHILKDQMASIDENLKTQDTLKKMVQLAHDLKNQLQKNNLSSFGEILHENWLLKKSISDNISNSEISSYYDTAMAAGAQGGKLLGAGAGGFLIFYVLPEKQESVIKSLAHLRQLKFGFEPQGSKIIFIY